VYKRKKRKKRMENTIREIEVGIVILLVLYMIEKKAINILFIYITTILTLAYLIGMYNCQYLSYILVLVYIGALVVLFGIIIMVDPIDERTSREDTQKEKKYSTPPYPLEEGKRKKV
jgi:NADH-ubiquinone/plastoquinone oxidoreductase chain 6